MQLKIVLNNCDNIEGRVDIKAMTGYPVLLKYGKNDVVPHLFERSFLDCQCTE